MCCGADAAVAERAHIAVEAAARIGVVEVDRLRIRHHELDLAERVASAPAAAASAGSCRPAPFTGTKPFLPASLVLDALGHFPPRVEDHADRSRRSAAASGSDSLPAMARCFQRLTPFSTSVAWKPGTLTMMYFCAEVARQPAPAIHVEPDSVDLGRRRVAGVISSAALSAAYCGCVGSSPSSAARMLCWASAERSSASCLAASRSLSTTHQSIRAGFLHVAQREVGRKPVEAVGRGLRHQQSDCGSGSPPRGPPDRNRRGSAPPCRPAGCR